MRESKAIFQNIAAQDLRHDSLMRFYAFHVLPGGRDGGHDKRTFEVFYGNRPFERVRELVQENGKIPQFRDRHLNAHGATLLYERSDDGIVLCTLYPACSENYRRREDAIILDVIRGTHVLTGAPILKRHWRAFMSYMQCTSLDGEPTIGDHLRIWWLLSTCRIIIGDKAEGAKVWTVAGRILTFSATIGLSGFLLAIVQWWFSKCQCH
jgi:hypothetical protein